MSKTRVWLTPSKELENLLNECTTECASVSLALDCTVTWNKPCLLHLYVVNNVALFCF